MNSNSHSDGFTLLEVLISIFILTFISIAISRLMINTYNLREVLTTEGDFHNSIRLSMGVLDRDITLMYSPTIMMAGQTPLSEAELTTLQQGENGKPTNFWGGAVDKTGIRPSRFMGTADRFSFISLSHIRVYRDSPESEFAMVSFELQPDNSDPEKSGLQALIKTEDPNAFDDEFKLVSSKQITKHIYPLLKGIKKFVVRYYSKEKDQWLTSWDSDKDEKYKYPDAIQISLEVTGGTRLFFEGTYEFRPEIPIYGLDPSS